MNVIDFNFAEVFMIQSRDLGEPEERWVDSATAKTEREAEDLRDRLYDESGSGARWDFRAVRKIIATITTAV